MSSSAPAVSQINGNEQQRLDGVTEQQQNLEAKKPSLSQPPSFTKLTSLSHLISIETKEICHNMCFIVVL